MNDSATATKQRVSGYHSNPDYRIDFVPGPGRVRVTFNGVTVADSGRAMEMLEGAYAPVYYLPREDVRMDLLRRTDHRSHCPYKGDASYWTLSVGEREAENAVWSYEDPLLGRRATYKSQRKIHPRCGPKPCSAFRRTVSWHQFRR